MFGCLWERGVIFVVWFVIVGLVGNIGCCVVTGIVVTSSSGVKCDAV